MLEQLTPEQAYELQAYAALEPFGEVRMDFRIAQMLHAYFTANSKKGVRIPPIGAYTLYPDIVEAAKERDGPADLQSALGRFAIKEEVDVGRG